MTNDLTTSQQAAPVAPQEKWQQTLDKALPSILNALPKHITADKFRQVAAAAIGSTPKLLECMRSNPNAVLVALSKCAADGLLPNGKEAALVPFSTKDRENNRWTLDLTYIPMIAGILKRMRQSGEIESMCARIVYANDDLKVVYGDEEKLEHRPCMDGDPGQPVAAYAVIKLSSGEVYREVMNRTQILAVKGVSKARNGPWEGPFQTEMWRKTVLKRAAKYCPFSDDVISTVLDRDNSLYDLDRVAGPSAAEERFPRLAQGDTRPRYNTVTDDDEVPAIDISEDEQDTETIDASSLTDGADEDESAPDASFPETSDGDTAGSSTPFPGDEPVAAAVDDSTARFYQATATTIRAAKGVEKTRALDDAKDNPLWKEMSDGQRRTIEAVAGAK